MADMIRDVAHFMEIADQRIEEVPQLPETRSQLFLVTIGSQMRDWAEQLKDEHTTGAMRARFMIEEMGEICEALGKGDLAEYADGLIDMIYVVIGAGHASGIPMEEVWNLVQEANIAKFPQCPTCDGSGEVTEDHGNGAVEVLGCPGCGGKGRIVVKDPQGKTIKPPGWKPPDVAGLLQQYIAHYAYASKGPPPQTKVGVEVTPEAIQEFAKQWNEMATDADWDALVDPTATGLLLDTIHDGDVKLGAVIDILSLIGDEFRDPVFPRDSPDGTPEMRAWREAWEDRVETWTQAQRDEVAYWAGAVHMAASDNGSVPYPPEVVRPFLKRVWAAKEQP